MTPIEFDDKQASEEGWSIFDAGTDGLQLQKIDEQDVFLEDVDAWNFVWEKAQVGSPYHQNALSFLREYAPDEYRRISKHVHQG